MIYISEFIKAYIGSIGKIVAFFTIVIIITAIILYIVGKKNQKTDKDKPVWVNSSESTSPAESLNKEKINAKLEDYVRSIDDFDTLVVEWNKRKRSVKTD